ncbi:unnamed protein product [Ambrosiozyma monospora]|uniref:Unnamed protein product n=1 Tax=Ambrosiozyma monospora TaxID=43982 RepID=A0A9W6Z1A8_AMBMO|nr:unnamed protein product [Ambrosiozyma monospora]
MTTTSRTSKTEQFAAEAIRRIREEKDNQIFKLILEYLFRPPNDEDSPTSQHAQLQRKQHVLERYMLRIAHNAFLPTAPQIRKEIVELLYNPRRMNAPGLSLRRLFYNINELSGRITVLLRIHYYFMHVFSWESPSKTLTCLVLYTWGVWYPQLFLIYPIIAIIFTVIIPNYSLNHEINKPRFGNGQLIHNLPFMGDPLLLGYLTGRDRSERQQMWKKKTNFDALDMVITDEDLANLDVDNDALLDLMTADKETTDFIKKVASS